MHMAGSIPCRQNVKVGVMGVCSLVSNKCLVPSEWLPWNVRNTAFSYAAANFYTAQQKSLIHMYLDVRTALGGLCKTE